MPQQHLQNVTPEFGNLIVWAVLGLVFMWGISLVARVVLDQLRPVSVFIIAAIFVGVVVVNLVAGL